MCQYFVDNLLLNVDITICSSNYNLNDIIVIMMCSLKTSWVKRFKDSNHNKGNKFSGKREWKDITSEKRKGDLFGDRIEEKGKNSKN